MNWKLALLATVVIASGCTSQGAEKATPDTSKTGSSTNSNTTTIYFTSSGFQPSSITVERGTEVTWINNASSKMWVGSDNHPRHTNYNGNPVPVHCSGGEPRSEDVFDQCSSGKRFSFTFDKTGTHGYHNHLAPQYDGTVTVR